MKKSYLQIGKRIALARATVNMTQFYLADIMGCTQGRISRIENGKRKIALDDLVKISEVFGKNINWFLTG